MISNSITSTLLRRVTRGTPTTRVRRSEKFRIRRRSRRRRRPLTFGKLPEIVRVYRHERSLYCAPRTCTSRRRVFEINNITTGRAVRGVSSCLSTTIESDADEVCNRYAVELVGVARVRLIITAERRRSTEVNNIIFGFYTRNMRSVHKRICLYCKTECLFYNFRVLRNSFTFSVLGNVN